MTQFEIVTDAQLDQAWGNANFGEAITKREVISETLLKCACGYYTGHTAKCIASELGLLDAKKWVLTKKGKEYLWDAFAQKKWG